MPAVQEEGIETIDGIDFSLKAIDVIVSGTHSGWLPFIGAKELRWSLILPILEVAVFEWKAVRPLPHSLTTSAVDDKRIALVFVKNASVR